MSKTARDLKPHAKNHNKGTKRGSIQVEESLKLYGAGRSVLADKNDLLIAGNHVAEAAAEQGLRIRVIETTGDELVVVKRTDLDLSDPDDKRALGLSYADNLTSRVGFAMDGDQLVEDLKDGLDLTPFLRQDEIDEFLKDEDEPKVKSGFQVKLEFTKDQHEQFAAHIARLGAKYAIEDIPSIVLLAMQDAK